MLKKILLLLILPIAFISASKGPEVSDSTIHLNMYVNDYNVRTLYYESIPILSQDSSSNLLSLIPIIAQDTVTGEVKMQILFSFYPNNSNNTTIMPKTMSILSHKRKVTLPVLNPQKILETNVNLITINSKQKQPTSTTVQAVQQTDTTLKTSGSIYVFVDDANKIIDLIKDTQQTTPDTTILATTVPSKNELNIKFVPRQYSLSDLQERLERNSSKGIVAEHLVRSTLLLGSPFHNGYRIVFSFDDGENLLLLPHYTSVLLNFVSFYIQLSTIHDMD